MAHVLIRSSHRMRHAALALGLVFLGAGMASACSSSSGSSRSDAGWQDAAGGANADGGGRFLRCQRSVADLCAVWSQHAGGCVMDWPADPRPFCSVYAQWLTFGGVGIALSCGAYRAIEVEGVDYGTNYYYDRDTGKLVAVVSRAVSGVRTCDGGLPGFVEPTCDSFRQLRCGNAGTDSGAGGASGSGGMSGGGAGGMSGAGGAP